MEQLDQGVLETESPRDFASRLEITFYDLRLLSRALTHRSYLNEHPEALEDNERLEFLGDAVLDFLVGAWLYKHFPEMREGQLTRLRSALVKNEQLAEFATHIGLGNALRLGRGERRTGGRQRKVLLGSAFEALVGALYLDGGMERVTEFIEPILDGAVGHILITHRDEDVKSRLQEWVQARGYGPPQYRIIGESGPEHQKTFEVEVLVNGEVVAYGTGQSKQAATKVAASAALETLFQE